MTRPEMAERMTAARALIFLCCLSFFPSVAQAQNAELIESLLPPLNPNTLISGYSTVTVPSVVNSPYFFVDSENKRLRAVSPQLLGYGYWSESWASGIRRNYVTAQREPAGMFRRIATSSTSQSDSFFGYPIYGTQFAEVEQQKVLKLLRAERDSLPCDKNYDFVLTKDGVLYMLRWATCSGGNEPDSYHSPVVVDSGITEGQVTINSYRGPFTHSQTGREVRLIYVKHRQLFELRGTQTWTTELALSYPRVIGTVPPEIIRPEVDVLNIDMDRMDYRICGINPSRQLWCSGVTRWSLTARTSVLQVQVHERTNAAYLAAENVVAYAMNPRKGYNRMRGRGVTYDGRLFSTGSESSVSLPDGSISSATYDERRLFWDTTMTAPNWHHDHPTANTLHPEGVPPGVALLSTNMVRNDIFARGSDNALWHKRWRGEWFNLGHSLQSAPYAINWNGGSHFDVFFRGGDNQLHKMTGDGTSWQTTALGGCLASTPQVVNPGPGARMDVVYKGCDGAIWHHWYDGNAWGMENLGGYAASEPQLVAWGPGRLDIFVQGGDNALWQLWHDGYGWGAASHGGYLKGAPSVLAKGENRLDVVYRGGDDAIYHHEWDGARWAVYRVGGVAPSDPKLSRGIANDLVVAVQGLDNAVWRATFDGYYRSWNWSYIGGSLNGPVDSVSRDTSWSYVFYPGMDGRTYQVNLSSGGVMAINSSTYQWN
jgi:hypothetical protein